MKFRCGKGPCDEIGENLCCYNCNKSNRCEHTCMAYKDVIYSIIDDCEKPNCKHTEEVREDV